MTYILIPSYEPNKKLINLIIELKKKTSNILVIDDGSGELYASIYEEIESMGITVVKHEVNQGKGAAIKTGINTIVERYLDIHSVVTCDSDGQHHYEDILHLYERANKDPKPMYLGVRNFKQKHVPFKSRFGNAFSSIYFFISTLKRCPDTQTGLRAIPLPLLDLSLRVKENRFDYEMVFLTQVAKKKYPMVYIPIQTIYENNNDHSHFRPVQDALLIYKKPLTYGFVGISSAMIDVLLFAIVIHILSNSVLSAVAIATVSARIISGLYNFLMNKYVSFNKKGSLKKHAIKYGILYVIQLLLSITLVYLSGQLLLPMTLAKIVIDGTLFLGSYVVQNKWVFK